MGSFTISDSDLENIKGQVVVVTGASAGIGLATVRILLSHGAKVYASDLNEMPEPERSQVAFSKVDVTSWSQQLEMFKAAKAQFGAIHHVFANAGIRPTVTLLEDDVDENGDLLPPKLNTINVNLIGVMYTVKLGIHFIKQSPEGGSIVMTGSGSSFARFSPTDYTTTKHGVYGLLRALHGNLYPDLPIRINAIAPSWTATDILPGQGVEQIGKLVPVQTADVPARSAVLLMADGSRHGQMVYTEDGRFWDVENGDDGLLAQVRRILGHDYDLENEGFKALKRKIEDLSMGRGVEADADADAGV